MTGIGGWQAMERLDAHPTSAGQPIWPTRTEPIRVASKSIAEGRLTCGVRRPFDCQLRYYCGVRWTRKTSWREVPSLESVPRVFSQFEVKITHCPSGDTFARGWYQ
jgi:hypothetical protein